MNKLKQLTAFLFGWLMPKASLSDDAAKALATLEQSEDAVEQARRALAATQQLAIDNSTEALKKLKAQEAEAAAAEVEAERLRKEAEGKFDEDTAARVAALELALKNLKANRETEKGVLTGELQAERDAAAREATIASDAEADIAARIEALRLGADAQDGLNDGLKS